MWAIKKAMDEVHVASTDEPKMKAAVYWIYGDPEALEVRNDIATRGPKGDEVRVRVHATSVNPIDWKIRSGALKWVMPSHFPKLVGRDLSGVVEQVGPEVSKFKPGDEVYGMPEALIGTSCEYVNCSQESLALKPKTINHDEAAGLPLACLTAWQGLLDIGKLKAGQKVLILGAAGGVGAFAVQIAKAKGAFVYATCGTDHVDFVTSLGADQVIDYKQQDFLQLLGRERVDLVFDTVGKKSERDKSFHVVKNGRVVTTNPEDVDSKSSGIFKALGVAFDVAWKNIANMATRSVSYIPYLCKESGKQLQEIAELVDQGKIKVPIDRIYDLAEIKNAHARSESGKTTGKLIVRIN